MRVLYDISTLAMGYADRKNRAGIFRAAEEVVVRLASRCGGALGLCAAVSPDLDADATAYLASMPALAGVRYHRSPAFKWPGYPALRRCRGWAGERSPWRRKFAWLAHKAARAVEEAAGAIATADLDRYDIYHSPYHPVPRTVRRTRNLACVLTAYDTIPVRFPQFYPPGFADDFDAIWRSVHPDDWVVAISESTKQDLCERYIQIVPARVKVIHLAASPRFYPCVDMAAIERVRARYGIPPGGRYLLSLNTLEPRKNIDHTIRCFARLVQENPLPDLYLVLAGGEGWLYDRILAEVASDGSIQDRVLMTGYVPDGELAPLYSGATAFLYPSRYEGFGLPPLEAMQCGTPVVTSDNSSLPEVVGDAGIMVDCMDADALCQAMLRLATDEDLRAALAKRALEQAARFSWERCADETIAAYRLAVGVAARPEREWLSAATSCL